MSHDILGHLDYQTTNNNRWKIYPHRVYVALTQRWDPTTQSFQIELFYKDLISIESKQVQFKFKRRFMLLKNKFGQV